MAVARILAYFSHSYRLEDREVNTFFWGLFHKAGFFFTVDPQSTLFSIPYLESMMLLSTCFVAVITRREGTPGGCSPYILFEYGLALQAKKPTLIFVEHGLSSETFPAHAGNVVAFKRDRERLELHEHDFVREIADLADKVRGFRDSDVRLQRPCGLVVGSGPAAEAVYRPELVELLRAELGKYGRPLEVVRQDFGMAFQFCLELDRYDCLIVEVRDHLQSPWLAGYLLGRAVPSIRVCHLDAGERAADAILSPIVAKHRPAGTKETPVTYWHEPADLVGHVTRHVAKFNTDRIEFHTLDAGRDYFSRAGRGDAKVFVSNASDSNKIAKALIRQLRLESIDFFHYQVKDAIPVGEDWLAELERQIKGAGIIVALVTRQFFDSQWCHFEMQVAQQRAAEGRLRIHPYMLEHGLWPEWRAIGMGDVQAKDSTDEPEAQVVGTIVADVDRELQRLGQRPAGEEPQVVRDAAAQNTARGLVLLDDERAQLVDLITARLRPEDGGARASVVKGMLIHALLYAHLGGEDFTGSADAVAVKLVAACESLGVLPTGRLAIVSLVSTLRDEKRMSSEALPFLTKLAQRLQGPLED